MNCPLSLCLWETQSTAYAHVTFYRFIIPLLFPPCLYEPLAIVLTIYHKEILIFLKHVLKDNIDLHIDVIKNECPRGKSQNASWHSRAFVTGPWYPACSLNYCHVDLLAVFLSTRLFITTYFCPHFSLSSLTLSSLNTVQITIHPSSCGSDQAFSVNTPWLP